MSLPHDTHVQEGKRVAHRWRLRDLPSRRRHGRGDAYERRRRKSGSAVGLCGRVAPQPIQCYPWPHAGMGFQNGSKRLEDGQR